MKVKFDFGINESATKDHITSIQTKFDPENCGEYLGTIIIGDKYYVVTMGEVKWNRGNIMVNEVTFDSYEDGSLVFYYNTQKDSACRRMEEKFNSREVREQLAKGISFQEFLDRIGPSLTGGTSPTLSTENIIKKMESCFIKNTEYIVPDDFKEPQSYLEGSSDDPYEHMEKRDVLTMSLTGLQPEVFQSLKDSKSRHTDSFYTTTVQGEKVQEENAGLKEQNQQLIQQNEMLQREVERLQRQLQELNSGYQR